MPFSLLVAPLALPEPLTVDDLIGLAVEVVVAWTADGGRLILARHGQLLIRRQPSWPRCDPLRRRHARCGC